MVTNASLSPAAPPDWPHKQSVLISDVLVLTYNKLRHPSFQEAYQHQEREAVLPRCNYRERRFRVKRDEPLAPSRECIVVPQQVLTGLLTALHIILGHPSSHQPKSVTKRYLLPCFRHGQSHRSHNASLSSLCFLAPYPHSPPPATIGTSSSSSAVANSYTGSVSVPNCHRPAGRRTSPHCIRCSFSPAQKCAPLLVYVEALMTINLNKALSIADVASASKGAYDPEELHVFRRRK